MTNAREPIDCDGIRVTSGDPVLLIRVPNELLSGLPQEDQAAIKDQVGKTLIISDFDAQGLAEIEFIDSESNPHTIWIQTNCLRKKR